MREQPTTISSFGRNWEINRAATTTPGAPTPDPLWLWRLKVLHYLWEQGREETTEEIPLAFILIRCTYESNLGFFCSVNVKQLWINLWEAWLLSRYFKRHSHRDSGLNKLLFISFPNNQSGETAQHEIWFWNQYVSLKQIHQNKTNALARHRGVTGTCKVEESISFPSEERQSMPTIPQYHQSPSPHLVCYIIFLKGKSFNSLTSPEFTQCVWSLISLYLII